MSYARFVHSRAWRIPAHAAIGVWYNPRQCVCPYGPKTRPKDFSEPDVPSTKAVRRPDQAPSSADGTQTIPEIK
jgi:hypothetical protein